MKRNRTPSSADSRVEPDNESRQLKELREFGEIYMVFYSEA